jgi:hypothetical protein
MDSVRLDKRNRGMMASVGESILGVWWQHIVISPDSGGYDDTRMSHLSIEATSEHGLQARRLNAVVLHAIIA